MENFLSNIGKYFLEFLSGLGRITIFFIQSIYYCFIPPYYFNIIIRQIIEIGFFSLPIVGLTAFFIGAVTVLQSSSSGIELDPSFIIPKVVTIAIIRELGPALISLIMIGKIGSSIAAEIGVMRVTEQIDALKSLNVNPFQYLVAPRLIASIIVFPFFVLCADLVGIFGGYITAIVKLNQNPNIYIRNTINFFHAYDFFIGLKKAIIFGGIISIISCYYGYFCKEGAHGVGFATTSTVVLSSVLVILLNYIITLIYL
ncbi:MlaE family ABC transporter permease [Wolbachia endosymbiont of Pentidionis agamae]|uniref:MlaE family ABC transporter permease n=1 Tax=Wolbachia endosymbiont of Pentidionis agamae TaxID=3110435 RepID=UPI002FD75665